MRVLEVMGSSGGGVVRHVRSLAGGLAEAGDDVVVAGPGESLGGIHLFAVEDVAISDRPRPWQDLRAVLALRRLSRDRELVHAHGLRAGALTVLAVRSRRRRPKLAVTLHNLPVGGGAIAAVSSALERIVARGSDVVLGVSPDLVELARARGARRVDLALVPAPVTPVADREAAPAAEDVRRTVRTELGVAGDDALLVTVARLAPQKGLELLADTLSILRDRPSGRRGVTAVIAGDGPLRSELEADVTARALPLRLLGNRDDVPRLFAAADVVLVTSVWEGQSLAVQEALRAGAVLVATDVGGNREVTHDAAVLVPRTTPESSARAFAEAVARVVDDPRHADDLSRRALARAAGLPTELDAVRQVRALA